MAFARRRHHNYILGSLVAPSRPLSKQEREKRREDSAIAGLDGWHGTPDDQPKPFRGWWPFWHNVPDDATVYRGSTTNAESFLITLVAFLIVLGALWSLTERLLTLISASACSVSTVYLPVTETETITVTNHAASSVLASPVTFTTTSTSTSTHTVTAMPTNGATFYFANSHGTTNWIGATPDNSYTSFVTETITSTVFPPAFTTTSFSLYSPALTTTSYSTHYVTVSVSSFDTDTATRSSFNAVGTAGWNASSTINAVGTGTSGLHSITGVPQRSTATTITGLHYWGTGTLTTSTSTQYSTITLDVSSSLTFLIPLSSASTANAITGVTTAIYTEAPTTMTLSVESVMANSSITTQTPSRLNSTASAPQATAGGVTGSLSFFSRVTTVPYALNRSATRTTMRNSLVVSNTTSLILANSWSSSIPSNSTSAGAIGATTTSSTTEPMPFFYTGGVYSPVTTASAALSKLSGSVSVVLPATTLTNSTIGTIYSHRSSSVSEFPGSVSGVSATTTLANSTIGTIYSRRSSSISEFPGSVSGVSATTKFTNSTIGTIYSHRSNSVSEFPGSVSTVSPTTTLTNSTSGIYYTHGTPMSSTVTVETTPASVSTSTSTLKSSTSVLNVTSGAPTPTACGEHGNFTLTFDDEPNFKPTPNITDPSQAQPVFNPYHQLYFSEGYVVIPPPTDPFPPISPPRLVMFLTNSSNTLTASPFSSGAIRPAEIGDGPASAVNAFHFNAYSAYLGCDNEGPGDCTMSINGYTFDETSSSEVLSYHQNASLPPCPHYTDCRLERVNFPDNFKDLSGIQITAWVNGGTEQRMWFMDNLSMGWSNNSCAAGLLRQSSPR